jgi:F0F1-type ATP synthase delta subunit
MELNTQKPWISDIVAQLHTKLEADNFLIQLSDLSESLFNNKINFKDKLNTLFSSDLSLSILNGIKEANIDENNRIEIQHYLEQISDSVKKTPIINITLAFRPKQSTTQKIYDWLSLRLRKPVLLNFKVERQIIAGAIIEFKGKYFEYTVHKSLNEYLTEHIKDLKPTHSSVPDINGKLH